MHTLVRFLAIMITVFLCVISSPAQFTHADSLRGGLPLERTCYDVRFYHLDVRIDPADSSVRGTNTIVFTATAASRRIQVDLFPVMSVDKITLTGASEALNYTRDGEAMFIDLPAVLKPGRQYSMRIDFGGRPQVAKNPPWGGGFTWARDSRGEPWIAVTSQGTGASLWWPCKDHQADEPDSVLLSVTVPTGLEDVSNGRLRSTTKLADGWTRFDWIISYPINNYNVTVNIGRFAHFSDTRTSIAGKPLTLDYYVLPENLDAAKAQFDQVKGMMQCFESTFGPYPFLRDGYKLIESPHLGMEHQTAVAYGNKYVNGYRGRGSSPAGVDFDFIIIHESAHEWWGNNVTSKDIADMWIHESFGAYAEAVYVECRWGKERALEYINGKKLNVRNDRPIIGTPGVNNEGSGDMYDKGQLVLNTLRHVIDNDTTWFGILSGLQKTYALSTVTADDIFGFINKAAGKDLTPIHDQYFRRTGIPKLIVFVTKKGTDVSARYRWSTDGGEFAMPAILSTGGGTSIRLNATNAWQTVALPGVDPRDVKVDEDRFYITSEVRRTYVDERVK